MTINALPSEILSIIFDLSGEDLRKLEQVCKKWQEVAGISYQSLGRKIGIVDKDINVKEAIKNRYKSQFLVYSQMFPKRHADNSATKIHTIAPGQLLCDIGPSQHTRLRELKDKVDTVVHISNQDLIHDTFNRICATYFCIDILMGDRYSLWGKSILLIKDEVKLNLVINSNRDDKNSEQLARLINWRKETTACSGQAWLLLRTNLSAPPFSKFDNCDENGIWYPDRKNQKTIALIEQNPLLIGFSAKTICITDNEFSMLEKHLPLEFRIRKSES